jgi:hypothetical protein
MRDSSAGLPWLAADSNGCVTMSIGVPIPHPQLTFLSVA